MNMLPEWDPIRPTTFSQTGQDLWVIGEVYNERRGGFFVEVGAADGMTLSNTYLLEKRFSWTGICVEADPEYFELLQKARSAVCVHACVDGMEREVEFAQRKLLGGILSEGLDNDPARAADDAYRTFRVRTRSLATILKEQSAPPTIDYLSIDVEGAEERILGPFPFASYRFNCITIERPKAGLRALLASHEYVVIKEIPGYDVFYVHRSFLDTYVANLFAFWTKPRGAAPGHSPPVNSVQRPSRSRRAWWRRIGV